MKITTLVKIYSQNQYQMLAGLYLKMSTITQSLPSNTYYPQNYPDKRHLLKHIQHWRKTAPKRDKKAVLWLLKQTHRLNFWVENNKKIIKNLLEIELLNK